jgi:hypothetical protein
MHSFWLQSESFAGLEPETFAWPKDAHLWSRFESPEYKVCQWAHLQVNPLILMQTLARLEWSADGRNLDNIQWASDRTEDMAASEAGLNPMALN